MVVQSSRSGYGPLNLALFDLGMVPWAGLSRGRATGTSFGSLCHFQIILGSFWDDFRIILGGPWGVPGESLGAPWGVPGGARGSPAPVRHRAPKKCQKCVAVLKNRPITYRSGMPRHRILGPPGESLFKPIRTRTLYCTTAREKYTVAKGS